LEEGSLLETFLTYEFPEFEQEERFVFCGPGVFLEGSNGKDVLFGDEKSGDSEFDKLFIGKGSKDDDLIDGSGNDGSPKNALIGYEGDDTLIGDSDKDVLYGEDDHDSRIGGDGKDTLIAGWDDDTMLGGNGVDKLFGFGGGQDYFDGGNGTDKIFAFGNGEDTINAADGNDKIFADLD